MKDAPEDPPAARSRARVEDRAIGTAAETDRYDMTKLAARDAARYFSPGESRQDAPRGWRAGRMEPLAGRHRERGRDRAGRRWRHPA